MTIRGNLLSLWGKAGLFFGKLGALTGFDIFLIVNLSEMAQSYFISYMQIFIKWQI